VASLSGHTNLCSSLPSVLQMCLHERQSERVCFSICNPEFQKWQADGRKERGHHLASFLFYPKERQSPREHHTNLYNPQDYLFPDPERLQRATVRQAHFATATYTQPLKVLIATCYTKKDALENSSTKVGTSKAIKALLQLYSNGNSTAMVGELTL
jgi:hypothetical protein